MPALKEEPDMFSARICSHAIKSPLATPPVSKGRLRTRGIRCLTLLYGVDLFIKRQATCRGFLYGVDLFIKHVFLEWDLCLLQSVSPAPISPMDYTTPLTPSVVDAMDKFFSNVETYQRNDQATAVCVAMATMIKLILIKDEVAMRWLLRSDNEFDGKVGN